MSAIISNAAYCTSCHTEVVSLDPLLPIQCRCTNIVISGGQLFINHTVQNQEQYRNWSIVMEGIVTTERFAYYIKDRKV